ncbi:hypothetical protein ICE94_06705 [Polynucleobacter sp. MWH-Loch1C5]|uniref:hypothetical protein n=1 Tax=Polynucleobacter sp. MWH-Loch1C5 TaxID=2689108 RepID=UPI001C0E26AE|nr:hypothetical protein [Polynucleobacter sp. MWH-Loch1C5]MBU3542961.1 hypothetical protein [Polynucleobacter sp. MWH-Loch1C5]
MIKDKKTTRLLRRHRDWISDCLPVDNSLVAYDIYLSIMEKYCANERCTVKVLFESLPHSYTAVRSHYQRLLKSNWIQVIKSDEDGRVKYVTPTAKSIKAFDKFTEIFNGNHHA